MNNWNIALVKGSEFKKENGCIGTENNCDSHIKGSFSGSSTAILGAASGHKLFGKIASGAKWLIPIPTKAIMNYDKGYLIIASKRRFGGLHSEKYNGRVEIHLNNKNVDSFGLKVIPAEHSDFFHRPLIPENIPLLKPLNSCQTIYTWDLWRERLSFRTFQELSIKISEFVRWDIDYIGFVYSTIDSNPEVFISYNHMDKDQALKIAEDLNEVGIKSWIDEGELNFGDSIIEKISDGLDSVKYLIALISKNSIASNWVKKELKIAITQEINNNEVRVIPLLLDESKMPTFLLDKYYGDITSAEKYNQVLNKIIMKIKMASNN